jgi:hypothetical protein
MIPSPERNFKGQYNKEKEVFEKGVIINFGTIIRHPDEHPDSVKGRESR